MPRVHNEKRVSNSSTVGCYITFCSTEAESDIPVHVRVHVHEGKISGRGLRYQGVVGVWSQDGGS